LSPAAWAFAVILLVVVKPVIMDLKSARVWHRDPEGHLMASGALALFSIAVGLTAGLFPAVILSRFEPIKVLEKIGSIKLFSRLTLRKGLLVFQFALSLTFIISVLVLYNQLSLFMRADHGFDMSSKYVIKLNSTSYETLKKELERYSSIVNAAGA